MVQLSDLPAVRAVADEAAAKLQAAVSVGQPGQQREPGQQRKRITHEWRTRFCHPDAESENETVVQHSYLDDLRGRAVVAGRCLAQGPCRGCSSAPSGTVWISRHVCWPGTAVVVDPAQLLVALLGCVGRRSRHTEAACVGHRSHDVAAMAEREKREINNRTAHRSQPSQKPSIATPRPGLRPEAVALRAVSPHAGGWFPRLGWVSSDEFSLRYSDLLTGSYDCVDRIVLNAFFPLGHNPGGFRVWWRRWHDDSDAELDNTHLMRMAGRFARRVNASRR